MAQQLIGASVFEESLFTHLMCHVNREAGIVDAYEQLAATNGSKAFGYLARMIVQDERHHHALFRDLADAIRDDVELRDPIQGVPRLDHWGDDTAAIAEATERFIAIEQEDAAELRRLERHLRDMRDTTLWQLLVRTIAADTHKHLMILRFVRDHLPRQPVLKALSAKLHKQTA